MSWFGKKPKKSEKVEAKNILKQNDITAHQIQIPKHELTPEAILEHVVKQAVSGNTQIVNEVIDQTIIGTAAEFNGDLTTKGNCTIEGRIRGNVSALNFTLEAGSTMSGNITANTAVIHGTLNGNIHANSIVISSEARIFGDLVYETISIEQGSHINGALKSKEQTKASGPRMPHIDEAKEIQNRPVKSA